MSRYQQLMNCADWNKEQSSVSSLLASNPRQPERDYHERRAVRLRQQADSLYEQAEDIGL